MNINWSELKEFCNSLNEEQLKKKVVLWREDEAISNIGVMELKTTNMYMKTIQMGAIHLVRQPSQKKS